MGFLSRFEGRMEDTFEGAADKMFDAPISPVQIAKKAEKQMRREKMVGAGKQYAPTLYTVLVNPDDDRRLMGYYPTLAGETETYLTAKASEQGLVMDGQPLVRFIVDDVMKFVLREQRRGRTYHGILMDPPSYGRGPNGEMWKIEDNLYPLVEECVKLLDGEAPAGLWDGLAEQVEALGFEVVRVSDAGQIGGADGLTDFRTRQVSVRTDVTEVNQVATLVHELAHALMHDPKDEEARQHRGIREVEAESVALPGDRRPRSR